MSVTHNYAKVHFSCTLFEPAHDREVLVLITYAQKSPLNAHADAPAGLEV